MGAPVPMVIYDDADRILHMSEGWTTHSGYTVEDVPTVTAWIDAAQPSSKTDVQAYVRKLYTATGPVHGREAPIVSWYQIHASGLMGSPTVPRRRSFERSDLAGHSSPQRMNERIAVGAV